MKQRRKRNETETKQRRNRDETERKHRHETNKMKPQKRYIKHHKNKCQDTGEDDPNR